MRLPAVILIVSMLPGAGRAATEPSPAAIVPYHATYVLTLKSSTDQGVLAAKGDMTYEVADACSGWTTSQRFSIQMTNRDGQDVTMLSDYATFETKDGTHLSFHTRETTDGAVTDAFDGTAVLDKSGGHGHADYTGPDHQRVPLPPGTRLPNAHTVAILQAGIAGKHFLSMPLFDGTSAGGALDTFVTIEPWRPAHTERWSALSTLPSGRVHVAFFDRGQTSEEPSYEIGMRYFDNGVADDLAMNFGDFVMDGKLVQFELNPATHC